METIVVSLVGVALFVFGLWWVNRPVPSKRPMAVNALVQPAKVRSGHQVWFAGEWYECSPPLGDNSPGWVSVRLTDRRTHNRVIVRSADEVQQA